MSVQTPETFFNFFRTSTSKSQIRILVTSRKEIYISKSFETILRGLYRSTQLEKIGSQSHVNDGDGAYAVEGAEVVGIDDISKFLKHTLSRIANTQE